MKHIVKLCIRVSGPRQKPEEALTNSFDLEFPVDAESKEAAARIFQNALSDLLTMHQETSNQLKRLTDIVMKEGKKNG